MRLIDGDRLKKVIDKNFYATGGALVMMQLIDEQPTVEPETGHWIDAVIPNDNGGLPVQVCDQCNTFFPLAYTGGGHRFCPNCGAKMEVEHD